MIMSSYCKYCPPPHFHSHTVCHPESVRFKINTRRLRAVKENISEANLIYIFQKKIQLDNLFNVSTNEIEYRYLARKVRQFNDVIEHFLRNFWTGINGRMILANLHGNNNNSNPRRNFG